MSRHFLEKRQAPSANGSGATTEPKEPDVEGPRRVEPKGRPRPHASRRVPDPVAQPYFWTIILFLVLEYVRPPLPTQLKLQMVIIVALPVACAFGRNRVWHSILTIQGLFFLEACIQIPLAYNNYSAYLFARVVWGNFAIAACLAWVLQNRRYFRRAVDIWVVILAYVGLYGLTHGGKGPGGFFGDENDLALACCTALPFAYFGFEKLEGTRKILAES